MDGSDHGLAPCFTLRPRISGIRRAGIGCADLTCIQRLGCMGWVGCGHLGVLGRDKSGSLGLGKSICTRPDEAHIISWTWQLSLFIQWNETFFFPKQTQGEINFTSIPLHSDDIR